MDRDAEVIVIGAGAAGIAAACELHRGGVDVLLLEGRNRIGGRILTRESPFAHPFELGAEMIHGTPAVIDRIVEKFSIPTVPRTQVVRATFEDGRFRTGGSLWKNTESVVQAIREHPHPSHSVGDYLDTLSPSAGDSARRFIEGYEAADVRLMGQEELALAEGDLTDGPPESRILPAGYIGVLNAMLGEAGGLRRRLRLRRNVKAITWRRGRCVIDTTCHGQKERYRCRKVIITVPIGVLRAKTIQFNPPIEAFHDHLSKVHMGAVIRFNLAFSEPIWREQVGLENAFISKISPSTSPDVPSPISFGTWWTTSRDDSFRIVGWMGGPKAKAASAFSNLELLRGMMHELSEMFGRTPKELRKRLIASAHHNWQNDPYALGAYSYLGVGGIRAVKALRVPVQSTLYFAGEGFTEGSERGTVQAAIETGSDAAQAVRHDR